ncbi:tyrosine-type recombinase/integrase [Caballeronia humi]|uniref:tyrosine-type recombinase/integrase n=1 Tax=Caballeronia humi TaxID=326474 RepID=UPI0035B53551
MINIAKAILAFRQVKAPSPMESGTPRSISVFHVWHLPPQFIFPVNRDSFREKFPSRSIGKPCFSVASSVLRMHASGCYTTFGMNDRQQPFHRQRGGLGDRRRAAALVEVIAIGSSTRASTDPADSPLRPRTRRAYRIDLQDFMSFAGIARPDEFRLVTRAHVLAWRNTLEERALSGATIRRKLAALSSLFEYLCEKNAVASNPVRWARRPTVDGNEGKTPAIGDRQARALLERRTRRPLRASAIARCSRCCSITACAARSCAC